MKLSQLSTMADPHVSPAITAEPELQSFFPNLPNDASVQCLARVPRSLHPTISLVCKPWLSLLRSPHFYSIRRSIFADEFSIYINIRLPTAPTTFKWFILQNLNSDPNQPRQIHSIPPIPSSQPIGASVVLLDSKIYVIGGSVNGIPTYGVWILDTIANRWERGPYMHVAREFAAAGAVNGKIYVIGGCRVNNRARTVNWAEVFDLETGLWSAVPTLDQSRMMKEDLMHASAVVRGKLYAMADREGVVYDAGGGGGWEEVPELLDMGWRRGRAATVGGVLYCYNYGGKIKGFDVQRNVWRELKGVEKELPAFMSGVTMVDVGGKLVVVWLLRKSGKKKVEVWCAEIVVEVGDEGELEGKVGWCGCVLDVPDGSRVVNCLGVGLCLYELMQS